MKRLIHQIITFSFALTFLLSFHFVALATEEGTSEENTVEVTEETTSETEVQVTTEEVTTEEVTTEEATTEAALAMTSVSTTKTKKTTCKLTWTNDGVASYYVVYRKAGNKKYTILATTTSTTYKDTSIKTGVIYKYKVKAVNMDSNKTSTSSAVVFNNKSIVSTSHSKYTYAEYTTDIELLSNKFSDYCTVNVLGQSVDGRNIYEVIVGNPDATKHVVVIANLHAREYMTTQLCMKQIEYYLENYNKKISGTKVATTLEDVAIHYIPSCNPDGTAISQFGVSSISSKKLQKKLKKMSGISYSSRWKANANGVDLNRAWGYHFLDTKKGYCSSGYGGTTANSQPEIVAILSMINRLKEDGEILGTISYHSTGRIIYGRTRTSVKKSVRETTAKMTNLAVSLTGYYLMPVEKDYYSKKNKTSNGSSRDYFLYKLKIPFITIEVGKGACPLSISEFSAIWAKNKTLVFEEAVLLLEDSE